VTLTIVDAGNAAGVGQALTHVPGGRYATCLSSACGANHARECASPDLSGFDVYTCGSLKMVETARPAFVAQGLAEDACFADAFHPAQSPAFAVGAAADRAR
jgi:ferredoxin-NADP reductase